MLLPFFMLAAAMQSPSPDAAPDPIARALEGLVAVVEEDGQPDEPLLGMQTRGCETIVTAAGRRWTIDWRRSEGVALHDTFVFVSAPPVRLAIVGDASRPDQAAKLLALNEAMQAIAGRCRAARP